MYITYKVVTKEPTLIVITCGELVAERFAPVSSV